MENLHGVTDDGLAALADLENLCSLTLSYVGNRGDGALVHLRGLKKLRSVYAFGTAITEEGASACARRCRGARW